MKQGRLCRSIYVVKPRLLVYRRPQVIGKISSSTRCTAKHGLDDKPSFRCRETKGRRRDSMHVYCTHHPYNRRGSAPVRRTCQGPSSEGPYPVIFIQTAAIETHLFDHDSARYKRKTINIRRMAKIMKRSERFQMGNQHATKKASILLSTIGLMYPTYTALTKWR